MAKAPQYIRWFDELSLRDIPLVGGKNASLGEMYQELIAEDINIPNGFAITADAYQYILDQADAWQALHDALDGLDPDDVSDLARRTQQARAIIYAAPLPDDLAEQILNAFRQLQQQYGEGLSVAVRSSATAEDFDERDPGVKEMIRLAVEGAKRNGKHSGLCGQAPSDYPEMAEYLVKIGIDSMSLNPDTVLATTQRVLAVEDMLAQHQN